MMDTVELFAGDIPAWHIDILNERMEENKAQSFLEDFETAMDEIERKLWGW